MLPLPDYGRVARHLEAITKGPWQSTFRQPSRWTGPLTNLMLFRTPSGGNGGTTCQRILGCRNEPRLDWLCFVNTNIGNEVLISLPPFSVLLVATRATATSGQRNRIATDVTSFLFGREKIADTSRHMSHTTGLTYCCSLS
jgi:hypothetical protein